MLTSNVITQKASTCFFKCSKLLKLIYKWVYNCEQLIVSLAVKSDTFDKTSKYFGAEQNLVNDFNFIISGSLFFMCYSSFFLNTSIWFCLYL